MEDIEVISDDSNDSGSTLRTPPRKKQQPKRAHGKLHRGKAVKTLSKGRKRKHVQSSSSVSSDSLPTSDTESSSSYNRTRMAKKSRLESQKSINVLQKHALLDVFQSNYDNLVTMIKSCPLTICGKLFSRGYISEDTWSQVVTGEASHLKKASLLLCDVRAHLKVHPHELIEFVKLLEEDKSFDILVDQMKGK